MTGEWKEGRTSASGKEVQGEYTMRDKRKWMEKTVRLKEAVIVEGEMLQYEAHLCLLSTFTAHTLI